MARRSKHDPITSLTDNSGGIAADTITIIGATYSQTQVANAVASLAAKIEAILQEMRDASSIRQ